MNHIIIGTAGHIDHGKTTLIKALTGRETDTLREEKERGISINLGFTYFDLPSGRRAGIIDVPGHERFIKNMLAGVSGVDLVLLVIAADEGIMPQTKEHLNILELLDIKKGIIVITKKDLVDDEWLKMVIEDTKNYLSESFLKDAPVLPLSSVTGEGIKELTRKIDEMTLSMAERDIITDFRLPIDRVFTVSGFGTVVTGTLISGTIHEGDPCQIYTKGINAKVRGIQVHEESVNSVTAGQRVAINISGVKTNEVERGDVLSKPGIMESSMMIDCRLRYLKDAPRPLKNRDRVRIYHGTSELLGRIILLDKEILNPGDTGLIQIRLEEEIAVRRGDKFVIRSYSPMITIGGGTILEPNPIKHKYLDKKAVNELMIKEKGNPEDIVEQVILKSSGQFPTKEDIIKLSGRGIADIEIIINKLKNRNNIIEMVLGESKLYIHEKYLKEIKNKSIELLNDFHKKFPLKTGISKEEFKNKIFGQNLKQKIFDSLIQLLEEDTIDANINEIRLMNFEVKLSKEQEEIKKEILREYSLSKFQPPKTSDFIRGFNKHEKIAYNVLNLLTDMGKLIKINEDMYLTAEVYDLEKKMLIEFLKDNGEIALSQFRDILGVSRKYAVAILEYFDSIKITKRVEDKRILVNKNI